MLVPTVRTVFTDVELCQALIKAWQKLFNTTPTKNQLAVIIGQHNLETGSGHECWNFNIANYKYVASAGDVDFCALTGVWEVINGVRVNVPPTNPSAWFRSFPTIDDGAVFYLEAVSGKRYHSAWSAVLAGDPASFSHLLKIHGYYTASETQYTAAVVAYYNKFMKATYYEQAMALVQSPAPIPTPQLTPLPVLPVPVVSPDPAPNVVPNTPPLTLTPWQQVLGYVFNILKTFGFIR